MIRMVGKTGRVESEFPDLDEMAQDVVWRTTDAVCAELGLRSRTDARRRVVAFGIASTWRDGRRLPLNLVNAGLAAVGA